jgi:mannose-1-phosphate guanylyltransferase
MSFAQSEMALFTIGIKPEEPATGYGYIQLGEGISESISRSLKSTFFNVKRFVEKPNLSKAKHYLKDGNYRWNAGMFIWSYAAIAEELKRQQPKLYAAVERWSSVRSLPKLNSVLSADYPKLDKISVDYAILENAKSIVCADGMFGWDDLGSWPALARHIKSDKDGNCSVADVVQVDSSNNIIFDARSNNLTPIALVGINDAIVVQSDDAIMIAAKSESQKIKQLVSKLAKDKRFKYLV